MGCCSRRETLDGKSSMEEVRREKLLTPKRGLARHPRDPRAGGQKSDSAGLGIVLETDEHHCDEQGHPMLFIATMAAGGPADACGELMAGGNTTYPR